MVSFPQVIKQEQMGFTQEGSRFQPALSPHGQHPGLSHHHLSPGWLPQLPCWSPCCHSCPYSLFSTQQSVALQKHKAGHSPPPLRTLQWSHPCGVKARGPASACKFPLRPHHQPSLPRSALAPWPLCCSFLHRACSCLRPVPQLHPEPGPLFPDEGMAPPSSL